MSPRPKVRCALSDVIGALFLQIALGFRAARSGRVDARKELRELESASNLRHPSAPIRRTLRWRHPRRRNRRGGKAVPRAHGTVPVKLATRKRSRPSASIHARQQAYPSVVCARSLKRLGSSSMEQIGLARPREVALLFYKAVVQDFYRVFRLRVVHCRIFHVLTSPIVCLSVRARGRRLHLPRYSRAPDECHSSHIVHENIIHPFRRMRTNSQVAERCTLRCCS